MVVVSVCDFGLVAGESPDLLMRLEVRSHLLRMLLVLRSFTCQRRWLLLDLVLLWIVTLLIVPHRHQRRLLSGPTGCRIRSLHRLQLLWYSLI